MLGGVLALLILLLGPGLVRGCRLERDRTVGGRADEPERTVGRSLTKAEQGLVERLR